MNVTLTWHELRHAAEVGVLRQIQNMRNGRAERARDNAPKDGPDAFAYHISGAIGELALCKATGRYWNFCSSCGERDVDGAEVRHRTRHTYDLTLSPKEVNEKSDVAFVLVTGPGRELRIRGWLYARDAQRDEWRHTWPQGHVSYRVPCVALKPSDSIPFDNVLK